MKFIYFNDEYYRVFSKDDYPQLELKPNRPYLPVTLHDGSEWAIPLRSNINHPHVWYTNRKKKCGLDYSKAVPLSDAYINDELNRDIYIRQEEFDKLQGNLWRIVNGFERYLEKYKDAKVDPEYPHRDLILRFSSLQYFEEMVS